MSAPRPTSPSDSGDAVMFSTGDTGGNRPKPSGVDAAVSSAFLGVAERIVFNARAASNQSLEEEKHDTSMQPTVRNTETGKHTLSSTQTSLVSSDQPHFQERQPMLKARRTVHKPSSSSPSPKSPLYPSPATEPDIGVASPELADGVALNQEIQFPPFSLERFSFYMNQDPPQCEQALRYIQDHSPGGSAMDLLEWQNARAQALRRLGELDSATSLLEQTVLPDIEAMIPNIDVPAEASSFLLFKANAQLELAYCRFESGNIEAAHSLCREAKKLLEENLSERMKREGALLKTEMLMTLILQNKNLNEEALRLVTSAYDTADQANHQERGTLHELRGDLLLTMRRLDLAKATFALAEEAYTQCFGENSPSRLRAQEKRRPLL